MSLHWSQVKHGSSLEELLISLKKDLEGTVEVNLSRWIAGEFSHTPPLWQEAVWYNPWQHNDEMSKKKQNIIAPFGSSKKVVFLITGPEVEFCDVVTPAGENNNTLEKG